MTLEDFRRSMAQDDRSPAGLWVPLQALWHEGRQDWDAAHGLVADGASPEAAWVHAYLHRREGDAANAAYWYCRAGRPRSGRDLAEEWADITRSLLAEADNTMR